MPADVTGNIRWFSYGQLQGAVRERSRSPRLAAASRGYAARWLTRLPNVRVIDHRCPIGLCVYYVPLPRRFVRVQQQASTTPTASPQTWSSTPVRPAPRARPSGSSRSVTPGPAVEKLARRHRLHHAPLLAGSPRDLAGDLGGHPGAESSHDKR